MRGAWKLVVGALAAVIALSGWRLVRAAADFAVAPAEAEAETGIGTAVDRPIRVSADAKGEAYRRMAAPGRAVVFVYSPECGPCNAGMGGWIDLVRHARGRVRLHAAAPMDTPAARAYWGALERHVEVALSDSAALSAALGVRSTPATLLVEDGVVRHEFLGPLTMAARRRIGEFVEGRQVERTERTTTEDDASD